MKKVLSFITILSILFTLVIVPANASTRNDLVNLKVTIPTTAETTIAPNRDFYVIGTIDGVDARPGQTVSIHGVVTPIQNEAKDITANPNNTFTFKDKITSIAYEITSDNVDEKTTKSVGLTRIRNGKNYYSDLEFKHDFKINDNLSGKDLSVTVYGLDSYGKVVAGTNEQFIIRVANNNAKSKTNSHVFKRVA